MLILILIIKIIMNKTIDIETGIPNEVANKIGISQSAYSQYEKSQKLRKATRIKIAEALQIKPELLDF